MLYRILFIIILHLIVLAQGCAPARSSRSSGAPLFIQVHYTNPLSGITLEAAERLLSGKAHNFKDIGGPDRPLHVRVDQAMEKNVRKKFPRLKFQAASFESDTLMADRSFVGLSDIRGLRPCYKILYIGGTLPWGRLRDDYSLADDRVYPLSLRGAEDWDPERHINIVQTATTAMTRAFIPSVDRSGDPLSPVRYTKNITRQADIAITSNEVSFVDNCAYPLKNNMVFCTPDRFFPIFTESGFNFIELTGNHNNDFGSRYNTRSIEMLEKAGIDYFGGGKNRADAERVHYRTVKGTVVALVGFNECGPDAAWATETKAGAARFRRDLFVSLIAEAVKKARVVLVTVQWCNENEPVPQEIQKKFFRLAADMGATIMISSSSHRPMGLEFYRGRFISYGLGNFLFDQMQTINTRRGLIARHHIYAGKHIATELIPILMHDYSQPRPLAGSDARALMDEVFRWSIGPAFR